MDGKIEHVSATSEAFGEHSLSWTAVFEWHSRFKAGRVSAEDDERSGRPSTSKTTENVEKIRELINENSRRTIRELADTAGISCGVSQEILRENLTVRHCSSITTTRPRTQNSAPIGRITTLTVAQTVRRQKTG
jgi:hypothetical protein